MSTTLNPEIADLREKVDGCVKELAENAWYRQSAQQHR